MKIIINYKTLQVVGSGDFSDDYQPGEGLSLMDAPAGFVPSDLDYAFFVNGELVIDKAQAMAKAKAERKLKVKEEAALLIETFDWRLGRARERAELGKTGVETVADVLAIREAIREASNAAEISIDGLTDMKSIRKFTWSVN